MVFGDKALRFGADDYRDVFKVDVNSSQRGGIHGVSALIRKSVVAFGVEEAPYARLGVVHISGKGFADVNVTHFHFLAAKACQGSIEQVRITHAMSLGSRIRPFEITESADLPADDYHTEAVSEAVVYERRADTDILIVIAIGRSVLGRGRVVDIGKVDNRGGRFFVAEHYALASRVFGEVRGSARFRRAADRPAAKIAFVNLAAERGRTADCRAVEGNDFGKNSVFTEVLVCRNTLCDRKIAVRGDGDVVSAAYNELCFVFFDEDREVFRRDIGKVRFAARRCRHGVRNGRIVYVRKRDFRARNSRAVRFYAE